MPETCSACAFDEEILSGAIGAYEPCVLADYEIISCRMAS